MDIKITQKDWENPQRFIAEGLGAPPFRLIGAKAQRSADYIHCVCSPK